MKKQQEVFIRPYEDKDFPAIHKLNGQEGWSNLAEKQDQTKAAWQGSNAALVAEQDGRLVGCVRALTDGSVTLYICELLIEKDNRGSGIGSRLMNHLHEMYPDTRMELLASSTSHSYYEAKRFRAFYGFRKTYGE
ncbi:GNAT family N-acetyltransferase [Planococcus beigongshangi]|uniref:GNAT family N-acetyltransferase n=1 Tax=Planococcus beigongshangi TaxID=2782536 RepID=UPI00193B60E4|nr:GNAT family N-acetyltransferase [Planococcus beigongshangi]